MIEVNCLIMNFEKMRIPSRTSTNSAVWETRKAWKVWSSIIECVKPSSTHHQRHRTNGGFNGRRWRWKWRRSGIHTDNLLDDGSAFCLLKRENHVMSSFSLFQTITLRRLSGIMRATDLHPTVLRSVQLGHPIEPKRILSSHWSAANLSTFFPK